MRTSTQPTAASSDPQSERPTGSKRVDERVAERAAEQERRRREAVSCIYCNLYKFLTFFNYSNLGLLI